MQATYSSEKINPAAINYNFSTVKVLNLGNPDLFKIYITHKSHKSPSPISTMSEIFPPALATQLYYIPSQAKKSTQSLKHKD